MDMIESTSTRSSWLLTPDLAKQASQITMYDIKSYYNSAKNMVLNIPEMEAKVREATNEDPWCVDCRPCARHAHSLSTVAQRRDHHGHTLTLYRGASSTLMQEIAQGTHNL